MFTIDFVTLKNHCKRDKSEEIHRKQPHLHLDKPGQTSLNQKGCHGYPARVAPGLAGMQRLLCADSRAGAYFKKAYLFLFLSGSQVAIHQQTH